MPRINFLNTHIDNLTMNEALNVVDELITRESPSYVVTPNLDHIVKIETDAEFSRIYADADLVVADGKPLIWISRLLKTPIKEKISGSDLFPRICELAARKGYSIYILGAAEGVGQKAANNLKKRYHNLTIAGVYSPKIGFEKDSDELKRIKEVILEAKPDILAVSLGSPKGEKFIYRHLQEYGVPLSISIGATIDFEAGNIKRAPKWISEIGFEWMFRITQDPKRLVKRYWNDAVKILPIIIKYKGKHNASFD